MKKNFLVLCLFTCNCLFAQEEFSTGFDMVWCGDAKIIFDKSCATNQLGVMFVHVHENETTAVEAAKAMMKKYGQGCFVTWQCEKDRYVQFKLGNKNFKFDPNRIYSAQGRKATLDSNGDYTPEADSLVKLAADTFLHKYVDSQKFVIALHNNTEGSLTIRSFKNEAQKIYINPARDADDFCLTTNASIYEFLKKKKMNVVLQKKNVKDDGSLSVYAGKHNISYLNVEAQHGHLQQQLEMLDAVQELINERYQ